VRQRLRHHPRLRLERKRLARNEGLADDLDHGCYVIDNCRLILILICK
jgi:hypothetical protein